MYLQAFSSDIKVGKFKQVQNSINNNTVLQCSENVSSLEEPDCDPGVVPTPGIMRLFSIHTAYICCLCSCLQVWKQGASLEPLVYPSCMWNQKIDYKSYRTLQSIGVLKSTPLSLQDSHMLAFSSTWKREWDRSVRTQNSVALSHKRTFFF